MPFSLVPAPGIQPSLTQSSPVRAVSFSVRPAVKPLAATRQRTWAHSSWATRVDRCDTRTPWLPTFPLTPCNPPPPLARPSTCTHKRAYTRLPRVLASLPLVCRESFREIFCPSRRLGGSRSSRAPTHQTVLCMRASGGRDDAVPPFRMQDQVRSRGSSEFLGRAPRADLVAMSCF